MGSQNFGSQSKTVEWNSDAADYTFNKRFLDIFPTGIYAGGLLKFISTTAFNVMPLVCEIKDHNGEYQVRIETTTDEQLTPDNTTPFVVLNWIYSAVTGDNYMDMILTATPNLYPNGLILGKCTFSGVDLNGFEYSDGTYERSTPDSAGYNFKALGNTGIASEERDMWFSGGRIPDLQGSNITKTLDVKLGKVTFAGVVGPHYIYLNRDAASAAPIITTSLSTAYEITHIVIAKATVNASGAVLLSEIVDLRQYIW